MGVPALRHEQTPVRSRSSHIRLVPARSSRPVATRRSAAARAEAARSAFRTFAILVTLLALLGMGRVWLSVKAAEASMAASTLRGDIKTERYEGDMLEVRQSALGSPSRIRAIAGEAMGMAPAHKVTYLDMAPADAGRTPAVADSTERSALERVIAGMMDLSAGEAQVLLVGDVGLASSK